MEHSSRAEVRTFARLSRRPRFRKQRRRQHEQEWRELIWLVRTFLPVLLLSFFHLWFTTSSEAIGVALCAIVLVLALFRLERHLRRRRR